MGQIKTVLGDITKLAVDAIVNAANERMLGGGGVDGAIHRAAGPQLYQECLKVPEVRPGVRCPTGEARITPGCNLPAKFVIHTVGPVYRNGRHGEPELLAACYRNSLTLAAEHGCKTVAIPSISTGVYGYPAEEAAPIAIREAKSFLATHPDMEITFCLFNSPRDKVDMKRLYDGLRCSASSSMNVETFFPRGLAYADSLNRWAKGEEEKTWNDKRPKSTMSEEDCAWTESVSLQIAKMVRRIDKFIDQKIPSQTASSRTSANYRAALDLARLQALAPRDASGRINRLLGVCDDIANSEAAGFTVKVLAGKWDLHAPSTQRPGHPGNVDFSDYAFTRTLFEAAGGTIIAQSDAWR